MALQNAQMLPATRLSGETVTDPVAQDQNLFGRAIDEFLGDITSKELNNDKNPYIKELLSSQREYTIARNGISHADLSASELQSFILELESQRRAGRGYRILQRLAPFMEALKNLLRMCESMTQATPFGVGAAFSGARIVLDLAVSHHTYFDIIVDAMERIGDNLMCYQKFAEAFESSPEFQDRLVRSYKRIIRFWYTVSRNLSQRKLVFKSITTSLIADTKEALDGLKEDCRHIEGLAYATESLQAKRGREDDLRQAIRHWIMGDYDHVDVREDQRAQLQRRQTGTCTWFLEDQRFIDWRDNTQQNAVLWYNAEPGSGKSVMASAIVDHLSKHGNSVIWWYFSFNNPRRRNGMSALRSLALQLLTVLDYIPDALVSVWEQEMKHHAISLDSPVVAAIAIHKLINQCGHIHIVIDGIDECADESDLLTILPPLIKQETHGLVKWLFTSRNHVSIRHTMDEVKATEITPDQDAVYKDVQTYFTANLTPRGFVSQYTEEEDNFLYARFVCETIKGENFTCDAEIEEALVKFPKDLTTYYTRSLEKIATQSEEKQELARRVFTLVVGTLQPITLDEAIDALSIRQGTKDYDPSRVPRAELIEELCSPLLTIESVEGGSSSRYLKLYHKTVEDFFLQDPDGLNVGYHLRKFFQTKKEISTELGLQCLAYLSYDRYAKSCDMEELLKNSPKEHSFLRYAATFWFQHLLYIEPSAAIVTAVKRFLKSKALWTCLGVQGRVSPYLFGRYASMKRKGTYKMGVRGVEWRGDDHFGVPLPQWLDQHSTELMQLDRSLCCFIEEWREVLVTFPEGLPACLPLVKIDGSCYLSPSSKSKSLKVLHLGDAFDMASVSEIYGFEVLVGKPLWAKILYQNKGGPPDEFQQLRVPLLSNKHQPVGSKYVLPVGIQDATEPFELVETETAETPSIEAWSVDQKTITIRRTSRWVSELIKLPLSMHRAFSVRKQDQQELIMEPIKSAMDKKIQVFRMMWRSRNKPSSNENYKNPDEPDSSADEYESSDENEEEDSVEDASSDEGSSNNDEDENENENDGNSSNDDESDDDESSVTSSTDETDNAHSEHNSVTSQEEEIDERQYTDCLLVLYPGKNPQWIEGWANRSSKWANIGVAVHPFLPILAVTHTAFKLEILDLETGKQQTKNLPELADLQETPVASTRELRFSPCGNYLHFLLISFLENGCGTRCHVKVSTFNFNNEGNSDDTLVRSFRAQNCSYIFWEALHNIANPLALTFWNDDTVIVALPPLTCDPKILKIMLPKETSGDNATDEGDDSIFTPRERICFPTTVTRRSHQLVYRSGSEGDDDYLYLCLGPLVMASTDNTTDHSRDKPPVVLRWKISSQDGWRACDTEIGQENCPNMEKSVIRRLRGNFVSENRSFGVPVRGGLNWSRKGFLSCA